MQNNAQKTNKNTILVIIAIVLIGAAIYFYMSGSPADESTLLVEEGAPTTDATLASNRILSLLSQINSLKIDPTLFTSEVYSSLVDHTVPIYPQSIGKSNPFRNVRPVTPR